MQEYKVARVHWTDACQLPGYRSADELATLHTEPLPIMQSIGWLIHDDGDCIALAQTVNAFKAGDILRIPRVLVVEMWINGQDTSNHGSHGI